MSLCCFVEIDGKTLMTSEKVAEHQIIDYTVNENELTANLKVTLGEGISLIENYTINEDGVTISLADIDNCGFMLPCFWFDGKDYTKITANQNNILIEYNGSICEYTFDGEIKSNEIYCNRNGQYKVYKVATKQVKIKLRRV